MPASLAEANVDHSIRITISFAVRLGDEDLKFVRFVRPRLPLTGS
jgi:hypothetical protein